MKRHLAVALAAALIAARASACGPYFPEVLLDDRQATLSQLPEGVFTEEASRLVPVPPGGFKPVERSEWFYSPEPPNRDAVEREMLGEDYERAAAIRQRVNAAIAYAAGEGLPEDARRYLAGAVAFEHDDMEQASLRFASVLELPPAERTRYGVWAAYMLARSDPDKALAAFRQVRSLVAAGAADPLGLAVDSYGEEARIHLDAGEDGAAIALYAQQAALGSRFGQASLLQVARALVRDPQRLERGIADPLTQKLVATYLLTRSGELESEWVDAGAASAPAAAGAIESFLGAIEKRGLDHVEGADRLAALAYRSGRYDLAEKFAAKDTGGLAAWVRAKLALRAGDANAAATAYAQAAKAFPAPQPSRIEESEDYLTPASSYCRVEGEAGTLALARGEYVAALEHLYAAAPTFWMDAAFVAERVLTLDELKAFVAAHAATPVKTAADTGRSDSEQRAGFLRALFARRLLRNERYDEAIAYFDDAELKTKASQYAAAHRASESGGRIERAEAWYRAAVLAREDGMDLLGYELDPDNQFFGGDFEVFSNFGYAPPSADSTATTATTAPISLKIDAGPEPAERERVAASAAKPDARFHYRYLAADFAARAADLVPHRSQAYAAMLCHATGWLMYRDLPAARVYYDRYVTNGPYVPWAKEFGTQCEEPDFAGAARRLHAERVAAMKRFARKALPYAVGFGVIAVAGIAVWWRRRRR